MSSDRLARKLRRATNLQRRMLAVIRDQRRRIKVLRRALQDREQSLQLATGVLRRNNLTREQQDHVHESGLYVS